MSARLEPVEPVETAPPGYHTEHQLREGLLIPGVIFTFFGACFTVAGLTSSAEMDDDIREARDMGEGARESAVKRHEYDGFFTGIGVAHLAIGVPLLASGIIFQRTVYVPNPVSVSLAPVLGPDRAGAAFQLTF